jgi:chromosome segregation ATPase
MGNENYLNYYVEILTGTMTDAVIRNISLQANARVTEDVVNEQVKKNNEYENVIENLKTELESIKTGKNQETDSKILNLENTINGLNNQLSEMNRMKGEYENVKHQVGHVDTFRSELIKERENHQKTRDEYEFKLKELDDQIKYLQLTPAKRKKIDEEKNKVVEVMEEISVLPITDDITKDGGSF